MFKRLKLPFSHVLLLRMCLVLAFAFTLAGAFVPLLSFIALPFLVIGLKAMLTGSPYEPDEYHFVFDEAKDFPACTKMFCSPKLPGSKQVKEVNLVNFEVLERSDFIIICNRKIASSLAEVPGYSGLSEKKRKMILPSLVSEHLDDVGLLERALTCPIAFFAFLADDLKNRSSDRAVKLIFRERCKQEKACKDLEHLALAIDNDRAPHLPRVRRLTDDECAEVVYQVFAYQLADLVAGVIR